MTDIVNSPGPSPTLEETEGNVSHDHDVDPGINLTNETQDQDYQLSPDDNGIEILGQPNDGMSWTGKKVGALVAGATLLAGISGFMMRGGADDSAERQEPRADTTEQIEPGVIEDSGTDTDTGADEPSASDVSFDQPASEASAEEAVDSKPEEVQEPEYLTSSEPAMFMGAENSWIPSGINAEEPGEIAQQTLNLVMCAELYYEEKCLGLLGLTPDSPGGESIRASHEYWNWNVQIPETTGIAAVVDTAEIVEESIDDDGVRSVTIEYTSHLLTSSGSTRDEPRASVSLVESGENALNPNTWTVTRVSAQTRE